MLGLIYLLTAGMAGYEICKNLLLDKKSGTGVNNLWVMLPASFGTGVLLLTWAVYVTAWFVSVYGEKRNPLFYGNLLVLMCAVAALAAGRYRSWRRGESFFQEKTVTDKRRFLKEIVFFSVLLIFITYMMFYVFFIRDGVLYSGFTVYGDYAPHTAMMRSFSLGNNFPTQYPHFGGEDVKYHFMFQFLTGNLEYLGMRIDLAYNIVSIVSLLGFLMLLYQLALRITRKMCCGVLACIFFFFRSGAAFFKFAWEHLQAGDLLQTLSENTSFIGYTANEDWGLWNF